MELSIVNENEKSVKYNVHDDTPELNSLKVPEGKSLVTVNKFSRKITPVDYKHLEKFCSLNFYRFKMFIRPLAREFHFTDDELDEKYNELIKRFIEKLDGQDFLKFQSEQDGLFLRFILTELVSENILKAGNTEILTALDVDGLLEKEEFNMETVDRLDETLENFKDRKNEFIEKYVRVLLDLDIPALSGFDVPKLNLSSLVVPEIDESQYDFSLPARPFIPKFNPGTVDLAGLSGDIQTLSGNIGSLNNKINEFNRIDQIKKFAKIKFECVDENTGTSLRVDRMEINGENFMDYRCEEINGRYFYSFSIETTCPYEVRLIKRRYKEKTFSARPKFAYSLNQVSEVDFGKIKLSKMDSLLITLTWGEIPKDLDSHMYSFDENFNQIEHIWFDSMDSYISDMHLDYDDVTSYGPEHIQISALDSRKYYLFSLHNFSLMKHGLASDAHMDYNGETRVKISLFNKSITLKPVSDGDSRNYWLDMFVIHDSRIIVLNSFASSFRPKTETFNFNGNEQERNILKRKIQESKDVHPFSEFK